MHTYVPIAYSLYSFAEILLDLRSPILRFIVILPLARYENALKFKAIAYA